MKAPLQRRLLLKLSPNTLCKLLVLIGCLVLLSVSMFATTIPFDPRQTYLLTNNDPAALYSVHIDLADLGLQSGMRINLYTTGTVCYYWDGTTCHLGPSVPWSVAGVFSSTSALGPSNTPNRVLGAIPSDGVPVFTLPTYYGDLQTDIPQDFSISALSGSQSGPITQVTIPANASFLFVTLNDSFYGDNYSTDLQLHISAVPEPSPIVSLSSGLISLALLLRRKLML